MLTTVTACVLILIQSLLDHREYTTSTLDSPEAKEVQYPLPTFEGWVKAFASIMFAFAGASTFPTIQADMKHKGQFKYSAIIACTSKDFKNQFILTQDS